MKDFINNAIDRAKSPTPTFWKIMQPIMGFGLGGLSAVQASLNDGSPQWIKWGLVFVIGGLSYYAGKFGTTNNELNK